MSSQRYRRLLTNLPSMATVVNSFQSAEVQREVYQLLIEALDDAVHEEDGGRSDAAPTPAATGGERSRRSSRRSSNSGSSKSDEALADVVEGDSIHSLGGDN